MRKLENETSVGKPPQRGKERKRTAEQRPRCCLSPVANCAFIPLGGKAVLRVQASHLLFGSSPGFSCKTTTSTERCGDIQHLLPFLSCRDHIGRTLSYTQSSTPSSPPPLETDGSPMKRDVQGGNPSYLLRDNELPL